MVAKELEADHMNLDIRIAVTWPDHPKTVKLARRLGPEAVICLVRLWCHAAQNKPDGILNGMSVEDIEIAAKWTGEYESFVKTLVDLKWLTEDAGCYTIHDWEEHNPYAFHAPKRKAKARLAANVRHAKSTIEQCSNGDLALRQSGNSTAPYPSPVPAPSPEPKKSEFFGLAEHIFSLIKTLNPNHKQPNLESWANDIRLMVERDSRTTTEIRDLFEWANKHHFWKTNILSPATLRKQWDKLVIQRDNQGGAHASSGRIDNSAPARVDRAIEQRNRQRAADPKRTG
jgi:hypothetical protein